MNFFSKTIGALAVFATTLVPMAQTATAAPLRAAQAAPAGDTSLVTNVQDRRYYRNSNRRYYRNDGRRYYRSRNNGAAIAGALIGGALIGGALAAPRARYYEPRRVYREAPRRAYGLSDAHIRSCYNRYRSYRVSDNTYQPYNGPRRQCY